MGEIIIVIAWAIFSLLTMVQYAPYCKDLDKWDQLTVGLILIIGGPFFAITTILEAILSEILPQGWND